MHIFLLRIFEKYENPDQCFPASSSGFSEDDIEEWSHNNLDIFFWAASDLYIILYPSPEPKTEKGYISLGMSKRIS